MTDFMHRISGGRLLAGLFALIMTVGGIFAFRTLPVDAFPDVTPSLVQIFTETDGLGPEEVEKYVTYPIEASMAGLPRIDHMRSVSNFGLSVVNIYFEDGTDVYFARQVAGERLSQARDAIPQGYGEPKMGPISTGLGIILYYKLVDDTGARSLIEMREIQDWIVKYQLQTVTGVTEVLSLGGYEKQFQLLIDPEAMQSYDIQINEVTEALKRGNLTLGAQFIEIGAEQFTVRGIGLARSVDDLAETMIKSRDGRQVRMRDVGEVVIGGGVRQGLATSNGKGEVVAGLVLKLYGANTSDVIERVKDRFHEISKTLPKGVRAVPYYDQGALVNKAAATVTNALWQGALLVALVVFVFLGGWRPSLVVVLSIPFSVGFAFISMHVLGIGANLMSLGGVAIAIGMMVDGAIVITENIDRSFSSAPNENRRDLVARSTSEVIAPLIASVLVVVVVFLPLFALEGVEGKTFRPLAASAALAMTGSVIYAALVVPAIAFGVMKPTKRRIYRESIMIRGIKTTASLFIRFRMAAIGLAAGLLIIGWFAGSRLGSEFTPELEEGDILLRVTMAPSISLTEGKATVTRIERQLLATFPEIDTIVTRVGRGEVGAVTDPTNSAEIFLAIKAKSEWRPEWSPEDLRHELSEFLERYPGIVANVGQPIAMAVDELLTGTRAELAIKIFGPDTDILIESSTKLQEVLRKIPGAADVQAEQLTGAPELKVTMDRDKLGRYGIDIKYALEALRTSVGGTKSGALFEGVRQFPIVVRLNESSRLEPKAIGRILLKSQSGALVPLSDVASIETVIGPRQITREDGERFIAVQANVRGRDIGSFVNEAQALANEGLDLPPGYRLVWGGQFELQQKANARFAVVIPITLAIVFLILLLTYGRLKSAVLILLNIPLALTGGALALWLTGLPVSVPATVGFIALFGVALGNGMVLVSFMDDFARMGRNLNDLAIDAVGLRARPVLMTAMTTTLGLAPLLFATGVGAEVQQPLATVVIGGLFTSTLLTLLVLPALHRWFAPKPDGHRSLLQSEHDTTHSVPLNGRVGTQ